MVFASHTYSTGTIRIHHYHTPLPHTYMRNNARREEVRSSRRLFLVPLSSSSSHLQRPRLTAAAAASVKEKGAGEGEEEGEAFCDLGRRKVTLYLAHRNTALRTLQSSPHTSQRTQHTRGRCTSSHHSSSPLRRTKTPPTTCHAMVDVSSVPMPCMRRAGRARVPAKRPMEEEAVSVSTMLRRPKANPTRMTVNVGMVVWCMSGVEAAACLGALGPDEDGWRKVGWVGRGGAPCGFGANTGKTYILLRMTRRKEGDA